MTPSRRAPPRNGGGVARRGFICVCFRRRRRSSGYRRRRVRAHASSTKGERNADTRAASSDATSVAAPRLVAVDEKRRAARRRKLKKIRVNTTAIERSSPIGRRRARRRKLTAPRHTNQPSGAFRNRWRCITLGQFYCRSLASIAFAYASIEWMTKSIFSRIYVMTNKLQNKLTTRLYRLTTLLVLKAQL